jgi:hypothetical protein
MCTLSLTLSLSLYIYIHIYIHVYYIRKTYIHTCTPTFYVVGRDATRVCSTVASFDPERASWSSQLSNMRKKIAAGSEASFDPSEASFAMQVWRQCTCPHA